MTRRPSLAALLWQWWHANYPDVARLVGLVLALYAAFVDKGRNPALIPLVGGLVLLKDVVNGKKGGDG